MSNEHETREPVEVERYELREPPRYGFDTNRREFVQVVGAGIIVSVSLRTSQAQRRGRQPRRSVKLSQRFHIGIDGLVTVLTSKVEVGQGSRTQITQAVAEELRLPADRIRVIMADTELCPDDGGTAGSRTTPSTIPQVRAAAVALREALVELAAKQLSVDSADVRIESGTFVSAVSNAQLTLEQLAKIDHLATSLDRPPAEIRALTPVTEWRLLGKSFSKVGAKEIVTGQATYPSDIVRPNMLHGKILRPVSLGATLGSIDLAPARQMSDVTVVHDGNFVGCAAKNSWLANRAIEAIADTAQWVRPPHPSSDVLFDHLKKTARTSGSGRSGPRVRSWGDREAGRAATHQRFEASYTIAYIHHAPMEPRAAVAEWNEGKLTVWTGTQQPARVRGELMAAFRLPEDRVRVIVPDTGGGFGGKHTGEAALEAARLARAADRPVSVRWTRQEEFTWAYSRPAGIVDVAAGLNADGQIVDWNFANFNSGGSAIETPYEVPHGQTRFLPCDSPLRQGSYRALASTANTFARESMMDELAHAARVDPLEFRLSHLPAGRLRDVLLDAIKQFQWQKRRAEAKGGRGVGLACGTEKGSYVAACAEVEVSQGTFRVHSICQAYECGTIHNPANLRSQVEGCILMGLGGALFEEMQFEHGVITNDLFSMYRVPRIKDVPQLDVVLRDRRDLPSVGGSETPIIAVAPAIANAVFHACGVRLRSMPLRSSELTVA